ncbi:MAG: RidA family protein [Candidatus Brocadiaceae bacterium]|nr:RidA family protein [Candidatus Brocadiaceae bacterium]
MGRIRRLFADGRLIGAGLYSDAIVVDLGPVYRITFAGKAADDPASGAVIGYEDHNGRFAPDALERQVADVFRQLERLMEDVAREIGTPVTVADLTAALVFLREDYPRAFARFDDAYAAEFEKRGVADYPIRTTVMRTTLPQPAALVEIQFEAMVEK